MRHAAIIAIIFTVCGSALGANLVANPSAESGGAVPDSWRAVPAAAGTWCDQGARFGEKSLGLDGAQLRAAWRSDTIPAESPQGYRLSGWIRSEGGTGWIEARFLGARGRLVETVRTPSASDAAWAYVAADLSASSVREAGSVSVVCRAEQGPCFFDGVRLSPLDRNLLRNTELTPMRLGDQDDPAGTPAGWHALPESDSRPVAVAEPSPDAGKALRLGTPGPDRVASYLVDLPDGARLCEMTAQILSDGAASYAISWFGPRGWMRDDAAEVAETGGRLQEVTVAAAPPPGANRVRVTFSLLRGESAFVKPMRLVAVTPPGAAEVEVFVNQVGYEPDGRKTAIVASTRFPARLDDARFAVVDGTGARISEGTLNPLGRVHEGAPDDWGRYYWLADFSDLRETGTYRIEAAIAGEGAESFPFDVARGVIFRATAELAYQFLYYQRCGGDVPGWHGPCHLDDGRLPDGSHVALAGGWHDAGDYNKWMYVEGPPLVLYGLASAYAAHRDYFDAIDRDANGRADLLDEILWGADWLMRMRNPATGGLYGSVSTGWSYWGKAERETDNIPGNDDDRPVADEHPAVAVAAAALAKTAQCVDDGESFLRAAVELEAYAKEKEGQGADRLLATVALWQATGDDAYLEQARACADAVAKGDPKGRQGRALAALALFVATAPGARENQDYRRAIEESLAWFTGMQEQPFPVVAGRAGDAQDMEEPRRVGEWGSHMGLTSNAWAGLACARAIGSQDAAQSAFTELDWMFGLNPLGLCMMDDVGSRNPSAYHHRYFDYPGHRDGAVPGAIPNGIARPPSRRDLDLPYFDSITRDPTSSEPWIPYTGYYLSALAMMEQAD